MANWWDQYDGAAAAPAPTPAPVPPPPVSAASGRPWWAAMEQGAVQQENELAGGMAAGDWGWASRAPSAESMPPGAYQVGAVDDVPHLDANGQPASVPTNQDVQGLQNQQAAVAYAARDGDSGGVLPRAPTYVAGEAPAGMLRPGNIDLSKRPVVHNKDGSYSTVRSITITADDGKAILIPTVVGDRVVSNKEAIAHFQRTGENLGVFSNEESADAYAGQLHDEQAKAYSGAASSASDLIGPNRFVQALRAAPAAAFDARFGAGTAAGYGAVNVDPTNEPTGPAFLSGDWWKQQLGGGGDGASYGEGAGYLIDNPLTRGLGQGAASINAGVGELLGRGISAVSPTAGQWWQRYVEAPAVERTRELQPAGDAGIGALTTQAIGNLGSQLSIGSLTGGAGEAAATGTGLMGAARVALASPQARTAAFLGATQAGNEAAQLEAEGKPVSADQLVTMASTATAANLVPMAGRWSLPARVASGAAVGEATNEANNVVTGRPLGSGAALAAGFGAALGVLPGHHSASLADEGRSLADQIAFGNRTDFLRDGVARQDFDERMGQAAEQTGGAVPDAIAQQLAAAVAQEHGTSVDALLRAPRGPAEAGAAAADQILADAQQAVAAAPAPITDAPTIAPEALRDVVPREPSLPQAPAGATRDDLVQAWRGASTDAERAAAAADIAAFDKLTGKADTAPVDAGAGEVAAPPVDSALPASPEAPPPGLSFQDAGRVIDDRLAALDAIAARARPNEDLRTLGREAGELEDLLRGEYAKRQSGVVRSGSNSLSDAELADAEQRLAATRGALEDHRQAVAAGNQARQLRDRLSRVDNDEELRQFAIRLAGVDDAPVRPAEVRPPAPVAEGTSSPWWSALENPPVAESPVARGEAMASRDTPPPDEAPVAPLHVEPAKEAEDQQFYAANQYFRDNVQGKQVTSPDGTPVVFSSSGRTKALSTGRRDARRMGIIRQLPELAARAPVIEEAADRANREGMAYAYAAVPVEIEGKTYGVKMIYRVGQEGGRRFYDFRGFEMEDPGAADRGLAEAAGAQGSPGSEPTIAQLREAFKKRPAFSADLEAGQGAASRDQVRKAATRAWGNRFIGKLEREGVLHVIDTDEAVSRGLASSADELRGVKGLYHDGRAYILADQVRDLAEVPGIVLHEAGLHYGYDRLTTETDRLALRRMVNRAIAAGDKDMVKAWQHAEKVGTPARALHEEAMAYLAEHTPGHGIVTRVVDALKRGLNRVGIPVSLLESDADAIRRTARDMLRAAASGERPTRARVEPDGVQDWRASSIEGAPVFSRSEPPESEAFRRFFDGSRVVDEEGRPRPVYHGTASDHTVFRGDVSGRATGHATASLGHFFTERRAQAEHYARNASDGVPAEERVVDAYLAVRHPTEMTLEQLQAVDSPEEARQLRRDLEAQGYDGIHIKDGRQWIAFDSRQIKSASENRGTFDATNPDIRFSRAPAAQVRQQAAAARTSILSHLAAQGYGQGAIGWTGNPAEYEGWRGGVQKAIAGLFDKMDPLRRAEGAITDATGQTIADDADVYRLENLMHGRAADRLDALDRTSVKPLLKAMKGFGVTPKLLMDYLYARHAPERNARIATINKDMPDGGSGLTTQEARDILAGNAPGPYSGQKISAADMPKLQALAARVDRVRDQTIATLEGSGQITPQLAGQLRKQWQHYVPLRGKEGEAETPKGAGRGVNIKGKPVKRALGRGAGNVAPPNILAEIVGDAQRAIIQAEKARVGRAVLKLAAEYPNPDLWQVEPVDLEWRFSESTGEAYLAPKRPTNDQDVLTVMHDGKPYMVRLKDPRIRDAVLNLGAEKAQWLVNTLGRFNRWLSAVSTRYNPAFTPINALRDMTLGMTGLTAEHGAAAAADAAANYLPALRSSWRDAAHAPGDASVPDAQKSMDDWAREFAERGGKTGLVHFNDVESTSRALEDKFRSGMELLGELRPLAAAGKALEKLQPIAHVVELANEATENALRLASYVALRKRGMSPDRAAAYAKDLTVNFNRKGQWAGVLNTLYLFYNASAQGVRRSLQLMRNPKVLGFLGSIAALQGAQTALLMSRKGDDGVSDWDAIPDWKKERSLIIALPGQGHYFALPMPYEFGFMVFAGGRLTQAALNREPSTKGNLVNDLGAGMLQAFSPIPLDNGPTGLAPELFKIPLHLAENRDDFGRRITADQPYATYDMPRTAMGKTGTAAPYVWLARALNRAGGGDPDFRPPEIARGLLDWSPEDLQYLSNTMLGGLGSFASGTWTSAEKLLAGNYKAKKDGSVAVDWQAMLRDFPIVKSFGWDTDSNRARSDRFYDIRDQIERTKAMVQAKLDDGDLEGAQRVAREAGVFADGMTVKTNQDGSPAMRLKHTDRGDVRTYQVGAVPGSLYAAYREASGGLSQRNEDTGYSEKVQSGVADYNRQIQRAYQLPVAERTRVIRELQDQRGGLMAAFLRLYEQRKRAVPTPGK
ncbi:LPD38 domain-containing protein [Luteibacter yeojuensis]|uniref:Large polyvalent protein-associated domain-containing protein n=1 Tax=Luteibacter yeojuensis TaxID=345309 RepID=A0A7X5TPY7_9GAMM|nr:LPD38 domain-containing protein [Luteibacter yeojuensis]NID14957.1 hypothetical protein [Luteibacter yeojuensis]